MAVTDPDSAVARVLVLGDRVFVEAEVISYMGNLRLRPVVKEDMRDTGYVLDPDRFIWHHEPLGDVGLDR